MAVAFGITGAISGAAFLEAAQDLNAMVPAVLDCVFAQAMRMVDESAAVVDESAAVKAQSGASMAAMSFTHGVSKTLAVETGFALQEAAAALLAEADALIHDYADYVPDAWLTAFDAPEDLVWEPGAPDALALSSISESGIEGTLEASGDEVALAFSYSDDQPEEAQDFTFTLGFGEETAEFEAILEPRAEVLDIEGVWAVEFYDGQDGFDQFIVFGQFADGLLPVEAYFDDGSCWDRHSESPWQWIGANEYRDSEGVLISFERESTDVLSMHVNDPSEEEDVRLHRRTGMTFEPVCG